MSISNLNKLMDRISSATVESPIAVFQAGPYSYDSIFADTMSAQMRMITEKKTLIGVFDMTMPRERVRLDLIAAAAAAPMICPASAIED